MTTTKKPPSRKVTKAERERRATKRRAEQLKRERRLSNDVIRRNELLEKELAALTRLKKSRRSLAIKPVEGVESQATAFMIASDWHIEEVVDPKTINGINEFNKRICEERVRRFFRHGLKLVKKEQRGTRIDTLVLALLGDFISGSIHDELVEGNRLRPVHAIIEAQGYIASGIQYLLDNSDLNIVIPCHSGNHGRMTHKVHVSTEAGNSMEYMMYVSLAQRFADEKRVTFVVSDGYLSYLDVYDCTVRFHHGHSVRYAGGVGGLTIPLNKAIAGWNKAHTATIDVLGHYHTFLDGGNFIVNGSLVGYGAYALSIKASPERPVQAFFLIDSRFGKTVVCPIILDHDR